MQRTFYETTTTALAMALKMMGHRPKMIRNVYSPDHLKKLRYRARDGSMKQPETVTEAFENGLAGEVTYYFEPSQELRGLVKAWGAVEAEFEATPNDEHELTLEHRMDCPHCNKTVTVEPTAQEFMAIACSIYRNAKIFNKLWKKVVPSVFIPNEGEIKRTANADGRGETIETPGFRMCPLNASKETMERLGIK